MIINNLIETHCHILPEIDDGAKSLEMSIEMIKRLQLQGVKKIIATPHYYSDSISLSDFIKRRNASYGRLCEALPANTPEIVLGAEVYISRYLFGNDDLADICIGDTKYALIEHPFSENFSDKSLERLSCLICDHKITPILAHIERYRYLMENTDILDELIDMGCLAQVNISSFDDSPRTIRKKLFKYLESERIAIIGSDCHNISTRPPDYQAGAKEIIKKCGDEKLKELIDNANTIFS